MWCESIGRGFGSSLLQSDRRTCSTFELTFELRSMDSRGRLSPHKIYGRVITSFGDVGRTNFTFLAALVCRVSGILSADRSIFLFQ
jgi:hypothetical protein